jgi:hypothetical protein
VCLAAGCGSRSTEIRPAAVTTEPEQMHRIYDFTPVSESNPIVARVEGTAVEIPLSELQGHLKAEVNDEERAKLTVEGKRKQLDRLIEELMLLEDAYQQKADQSPRVADTLDGTRKMLLAEFLTKEEVDDKAKTGDDHTRLRKVLRERLLQKTPITVSNEAFADLKAALAKAGKEPGEVPAELAPRPLARCADTTITMGEVWKAWAAAPPGERRDIRTPAGLSAVLEDLSEDVVKVAEAKARGIDKTRPYREKVEANRAALTRMWFQDRVTREASERMKSPEIEGRLRQWYQDHLKTRYTYKDPQGQEKVVVFEQEKESIKNDYFDQLRESVRIERARQLIGSKKVIVDERLVAGA